MDPTQVPWLVAHRISIGRLTILKRARPDLAFQVRECKVDDSGEPCVGVGCGMAVPPPFATLLRTLAGLKEPTFDDPVRSALRAWLATEVPSHVGPVLLMVPRLPLAAAGVVSVWLGSTVEEGADPTAALPVLMDTLLHHLNRLDLEAADEATLTALQWLSQGIVAHLVAAPDARQAWSERADAREVLEAAAEVSVGAMWLDALLGRRSTRLLALHGNGDWAYWVEAEEIGNLFALFTLFQDALPFDGGARLEAWFHYQNASGGLDATLGASAWGEASLDALERVDEVPVLVCFAPLLGCREWNDGFLGPHFDAAPMRVDVTPLTPEELTTWRAKVQGASS